MLSNTRRQEHRPSGRPGQDTVPAACRPGWYGPLRRAAEWCAAWLLLLLTAPVIAACVLVVKLTSAGPGFYCQTRLGLYGRPFTILKIRTMTHNCELASGPQWSSPGDFRVTPIGRFLRDTHLDELPQLWNVIRGDMSLIGPRPERPELTPRLEREVPEYAARWRVRPGITGLAQLYLPPDLDLESVRRKIAYDIYYIKNISPIMDMFITIETALIMAAGLGRALRIAAARVDRRPVVGSTHDRRPERRFFRVPAPRRVPPRGTMVARLLACQSVQGRDDSPVPETEDAAPDRP
jgi:lipopolysaccharide/colanic/teichoic acid biosynthesis glycosyltransferase